MAFTAKLELRQSHSLVMTPQLQQAIKLLQLSNMELTAFVEASLGARENKALQWLIHLDRCASSAQALRPDQT